MVTIFKNTVRYPYMKTTPTLAASFCFMVCSTSLLAQNVDKKSKELGLFVETAMNNYYTSSNATFGLQFKKETKKNKAIRCQILHQQKNYQNDLYNFAIMGDTMKQTRVVRKHKSVFIGFGIEQQRQFYKKVFLYASLDARLGYGFSTFYKTFTSAYTVVDTSNGLIFSKNFSQSSTPEKISNIRANQFALDILPSIGTKLVFQKLVLGFETGLNFSNAYFSQKGSALKEYSIYDLDLSFINYRAYVNYRF